MRHTPGRDDRLHNTDETAGYVGGRIQCPIFCTLDPFIIGDGRNFAWDPDLAFVKKHPEVAKPPDVDPFRYAGTHGFIAVLDITKFYYYSPESHFGTSTEDLLAMNWYRLLQRMDGIDIKNQAAVNRFIGNRIVPVRNNPESQIPKPDPRRFFVTVQNESAASMMPFVSSAQALNPVDRIKGGNQDLALYRQQRLRVSNPLNQRLARKG